MADAPTLVCIGNLTIDAAPAIQHPWMQVTNARLVGPRMAT
jgi:hypothetical protein